MRTGFTTQVVPESRVDFSGPHPVILDNTDPPASLDGQVWYSVGVVVTVEGGEVTSVRVYDESITLDAEQPEASPAVVEVAETSDYWPAWTIG